MSKSDSVQEDVKEPIANPSKKFSKVRFLQILGLLNKNFNHTTFRFEPSLLFNCIFYSSLLLKPLFTLKPFISYLFPKNHPAQLVIGNFFNYLPDKPRIFFGVAASIV